jgi:hypothetical protein
MSVLTTREGTNRLLCNDCNPSVLAVDETFVLPLRGGVHGGVDSFAPSPPPPKPRARNIAERARDRARTARGKEASFGIDAADGLGISCGETEAEHREGVHVRIQAGLMEPKRVEILDRVRQ